MRNTANGDTLTNAACNPDAIANTADANGDTLTPATTNRHAITCDADAHSGIFAKSYGSADPAGGIPDACASIPGGWLKRDK